MLLRVSRGLPSHWVLPDPHPASERWGLLGWLVALRDGGLQWTLPEWWEAQPNGTAVSPQPHPTTAQIVPSGPPEMKLGSGPRTLDRHQVSLGSVSSYRLRKGWFLGLARA